MFINISFAPVETAFREFVSHYGFIFDAIKGVLLQVFLVPLEDALRGAPPWLILLGVGLIAYHATRHWLPPLFYVLCLYLVGCFGLWDKLMSTTALMLVSTAICVVFGIPIGILISRSNWLRAIALPILDVMQTMPSFVYLIPMIFLWGVGQVSAIFAIVVYAIPPLIRLTDLGIRQVDREVVEAATSFGTTPWQLLLNVQLPLARPSIMAGINQTVMMALAMVVLATLIGARGLGETVNQGIANLEIGTGLQGGVAIVLLAIVIDRITQAYGMDARQRRQRLLKGGSFANFQRTTGEKA
ncbi:ABC transporter permease [Meiothermus granaticius]|uniref:Glycine betaine/proline betaine transport system permease protein ProW n=1 Tax=Meiothermus granaticius NBRC 107808 TaxID=1227551 RepID=A0A399F998_9DEIN|nr:proline/glycine betaine ABC transporter permease [Meiothermus granaticius]MCL6526198.1 proline/glycine betaine ABC transporter permease [Thermaceae bacterium]RIH92710.1 Glycine betaine/proline betaine transport system permease protein ProW [Meiothermus granaticius NBRC 107808]